MFASLIAALLLISHGQASPTLTQWLAESSTDGKVNEGQFWRKVEAAKLPIYDTDGTPRGRTFVTFVWKGDADTRNVIVSLDRERNIRDLALERVAGTNIWHRTYSFPSDSAFYYQLAPNDSLLPFEDERNWDTREKNFVADPFNPLGVVIGGTRHFSFAILPGHREHPSYATDTGAPAGKFEPGDRKAFVISDEKLGDHRIWVYSTPGQAAGPLNLIVFLDGSGRWQLIPSVRMLDNMYHTGQIGPTIALYTDSPDRNRDLACNDEYLKFLIEELIPFVKERHKSEFSPSRTVICGASLGGLFAGYAALRRADVFGRALMQSPSLWWSPEGDAENEWLARQFAESPNSGARFFIAPGAFETTANRPDSISILFSSRHLRDVLRAKGYQCVYREVNGGHDPLNWKASLPDGIVALLGKQ